MQHSLIDNNTATGTGGGVVNIGGVETPDRGLLGAVDSTIFDNTAGDRRRRRHRLARRHVNIVIARPRRRWPTTSAACAASAALDVASGTGAGRRQHLRPQHRSAARRPTAARRKPTNGGLQRRGREGRAASRSAASTPGWRPTLASAGRRGRRAGDRRRQPGRRPRPARATAGGQRIDQRGICRPQGPRCDSGAYELDQAATMTITAGPTGTVTTDRRAVRLQLERAGREPGLPAHRARARAAATSPVTSPTRSRTRASANGSYTFSVARRRVPELDAGDADVHGRGARHDDHRRPDRADQRHHADVHVHRRRRRRELPVPRRQRGVRARAPRRSPTAALAQGPHTFEVRALTPPAAPDPTPASRTFTVDTIAPDTTITGGPTGTVASTSATFTFTSTESRLDVPVRARRRRLRRLPRRLHRPRQGSHTFQVRATDAAGNIDADARHAHLDRRHRRARHDDHRRPDAAPSPATSATFTFTSTEAGSTFQCPLDGAAFGACPAGYTGLAQGAHTFQVRAIDAAGNIDATPATRTWTVDTVAPDTTITAGPTGPTATTPRRRSRFTSTEAGATFQCRARRRRASAPALAGYTGARARARTRSRSAPSTPPATPTPTPADAHLDRRHRRAGHDDHRRPEQPEQRHHADVHLHLDRGRLDVPVPRRRRRLRHLHLAVHHADARPTARHTFEVRADRRRRQRRRDARARRRSWSTPTAPDTTITRRPRAADQRHHADVHVHRLRGGRDASSAASTAPRSPPAPRRSRPARSPRAPTPFERPRDRRRRQHRRDARDATFTVDLTAPGTPTITAPADNALLTTTTVHLHGSAEAGATVDITEGATARGSAVASCTAPGPSC